MSQPAGRYSYRTLLLATCLGLALGAAGLFTAISWRVQLRAARQLEETRVQLALLQVNRRVQVLLSQAIEVNHAAQELINADRFSPADFDSLSSGLLPALRQGGDAAYIGASVAATGEGVFLLRLANDSVARIEYLLVRGAARVRVYAAAPGQGFRFVSERAVPLTDHRTRPWYIAAAQAKRAVWTPSYDFADRNQNTRPGVSYATPMYSSNGRLAAVVASDLDTRILSTLLARWRERFPGDVFILEERSDRSRRLIAHPRSEVLLDSTGKRLWDRAEAAPDSGVRGVIRLLDEPFRLLGDRTNTPLRFATAGVKFTGAYTLPVGRDRPNWLVAVTLPESVALADLRKSQRSALLAMAVLAVLTVIVATWLSRRLSGPIEQLVSEAKEVSGDRGTINLPPSGPREVMRLAQVYQTLLDGSRAQRDKLTELNRDLQASNEALQREIQGRRAATSRSESLEHQLLQSQKFEAIGTLAGGIAHDFNNVLTAILGNAEILKLDLPSDSPAGASASAIESAAHRARDLVKRILTFSRRDAPERTRVRASALVSEAVALLRASAPARIRLHTELASEGDLLDVEAGQFVQVLLNLGTNAIHAMPRGDGELRFVATIKRLPDDGPLPAGLEPAWYVAITVSDTGCGIPPESLGRIFDPFFTTKPAGEGTGLGLAIVYGIVQAHGGAITATSRIGEGTTFEILLPGAQTPAGAPQATTGSGDTLPQGRGERVLVIDDESAILSMAGLMLEQLGYQPLLFSDPHAAIREATERGDEVSAVIVDLSMPTLDGAEVARILHQRLPSLPILLASGSAGSMNQTAARALGFTSLLEKPYSMRALAHQLAAALQDPTPPQETAYSQ